MEDMHTTTTRTVIGRSESTIDGCGMNSSPIFSDDRPADVLRHAERMASTYDAIPGNEGRVEIVWYRYTDDDLVRVGSVHEVFAPFTREELTDIARDAFMGAVEVDRNGYRYRFAIEQDDISVMEHVNGVDAYGRLAWPDYDRDTGRNRRPADFTGAARKFGLTQMHDEIWWEPYREGHKVYDDPATVDFMRELLDYGFIGCVVTRLEQCDHGDDHEVAHASLWGIESPLVGAGNYEYLAEVFGDLVHEVTPDTTTDDTTTTGTTTTTPTPTPVDYGDVWVCEDCYMTHHNGAHEHDGQWFVDGSDTPCDRVPLGELDGFEIADNTCSNHEVEDTFDEDGDRTGETTQCPHCSQDGDEDGIQTFSWRRCGGCGSTLGGARYRLHLWKREDASTDEVRDA